MKSIKRLAMLAVAAVAFTAASAQGKCELSAAQNPLEVAQGATFTLTLNLTNDIIPSCWQTDIVLPDGFSFVQGRKYDASYSDRVDPETYTTAVVKQNKKVNAIQTTAYTQCREDQIEYFVQPGSGEFFSIKIVAPEAKGVYEISVEDILFVTLAEEQYRTANFTVTVEVKDMSGVENIEAGANASGIYYDLQGRRIENPSKGGLYITDGKKVVVK